MPKKMKFRVIRIYHLNPYKDNFGKRWKDIHVKGLTRFVSYTYTRED